MQRPWTEQIILLSLCTSSPSPQTLSFLTHMQDKENGPGTEQIPHSTCRSVRLTGSDPTDSPFSSIVFKFSSFWLLQTVIQIYFKQLLGDLSTRTFQEAHRATSQRWLLHQWPKQEEEENTLPGLQGMVITVYQSLTLTSAHSRLRLQSGGALQGKGLCLLLIWPLQYSLFFGGFFPPLYPALVSLWHSQRGKHDSSSSARHTAVRLGFFFFYTLFYCYCKANREHVQIL